MKSNSPIRIWDSSPSMKLLAFFLENPSQRLFGAEVAKATKLSAGAVHKHLAGLEKEGLLVSSSKGRMKFFEFNRGNPAARHLKIAYTLSSPPMQALACSAGAVENVEVFLYGSAARGEDDEKSDWDILVLHTGERPPMGDMFRKAIRLASPREIRPSLHTRNEWASRAKEDRAFYESVERDKIRIA